MRGNSPLAIRMRAGTANKGWLNETTTGLGAGFIRLPKMLKAPTASATSVGIATAQADECVPNRSKIRAGNTMPDKAQSIGRITAFG